MVRNCFLCAAARGDPDMPWHDKPLWLDPRTGLMTPGLGGFLPGYVMLAPLAHEVNLRRAIATACSAFGSFLDAALIFLIQQLGPITFWEHGAPSGMEKRRSACIEHAHLHVAPGRLPLPLPPQPQIFPSLVDALTEAVRLDEADGYLLLGWSDGDVALGNDIMIPQYYRREWAKLIGRESEWDYLLAEEPAITRATIKLVLTSGGD